MSFTSNRFGAFRGRRLVWGATPRARAVRPTTGSPFFRPEPAVSAARGLPIGPAIAAASVETSPRVRAA